MEKVYLDDKLWAVRVVPTGLAKLRRETQ